MYLSTCEITIHPDNTWEGQVRIFHDDLEDAITNLTGQRPKLTTESLPSCYGKIQDYLRKHLIISDRNGKINIDLERAAVLQDVVEIIISGSRINEDESYIENNILLEIFETQKNIMVIKKSGEIKTLYFKKNQTKESITF